MLEDKQEAAVTDKTTKRLRKQIDNLVQKRALTKTNPDHLPAREIAAIRKMTHEELVLLYVGQKEQTNKVLRTLAKLKQLITDFTDLGL